MYDPDSDNEIKGDFGIVEYYDNSDNYKKLNITISKGLPIKNPKKNKPSYITVNKASLKKTHPKKFNENGYYLQQKRRGKLRKDPRLQAIKPRPT